MMSVLFLANSFIKMNCQIISVYQAFNYDTSSEVNSMAKLFKAVEFLHVLISLFFITHVGVGNGNKINGIF